MSTTVELDGRLQLNLLSHVGRRDSLRVGLFGSIQAVDVGLVVLGVVDLHDLAADRRLQRLVLIRQLGQGVFVCRGCEAERFSTPVSPPRNARDAPMVDYVERGEGWVKGQPILLCYIPRLARALAALCAPLSPRST